MDIAKAVLDTDCLLADANKTLYDAKLTSSPQKALYSLLNSALKERSSALIYLSEYVKGVLSDFDISPINRTAHYMILKNIEQSKFEEAILDYIKKHEFPGARGFINSYKSVGNKKFMISSRHNYAEIAKKYFNADDAATNSSIFKDGVFQGSLLPIQTGQDKLRETEKLLDKYSLDLDDCAFIGDGKKDISLGERSRIFLASPHANKEVKDKADFFINDYRQLDHKIRKLI